MARRPTPDERNNRPRGVNDTDPPVPTKPYSSASHGMNSRRQARESDSRDPTDNMPSNQPPFTSQNPTSRPPHEMASRRPSVHGPPANSSQMFPSHRQQGRELDPPRPMNQTSCFSSASTPASVSGYPAGSDHHSQQVTDPVSARILNQASNSRTPSSQPSRSTSSRPQQDHDAPYSSSVPRSLPVNTHPVSPNQPTGKRSLQGDDMSSTRLDSQTYQTPVHAPLRISSRVSSELVPPHNTGSRPQQSSSVFGPPTNSFPVALGQNTGRGQQQGHETEPVGTSSQTPSAYVSRASDQSIPRDSGNRSQHNYETGTARSNDQASYQPFVDGAAGSSLRTQAAFVHDIDATLTVTPTIQMRRTSTYGSSGSSSSMAPNQPFLPPRGTESLPREAHHTVSMVSTRHGFHRSSASGTSANNSQAVYNQLSGASQSTGNQVHDTPGPFRTPVSEPPANSHPQRRYGRDLTGEVEILLSPGKRYQWSIGTGAFTDVFKGKVRAGIVSAESTYVAVKLFRATTEEDPEIENTKRRLVRESNVWLRLDHPNIQPYLGHCSDLGPCLALISPLCGHGSIMKYLVKYPSAQRLQLVKEVAKGLEYLHSKQVIHADLHCKNILVDDEGNALLADFGRAKVIGEAGYSTALLAGSAPYMAPELFPSAEPPESEVNVDELFSKQSDVYAFAMVCFEIFTNEIPFASYHRRCLDWQVVPLIKQGKRPQNTPRVQSVISPSMWMVMEECWKQKPEARISAEEVVQRMDGF